MDNIHPRRNEGIIGSGVLVWQHVNPKENHGVGYTLDAEKRAYILDKTGEIVAADDPRLLRELVKNEVYRITNARATPAAGWKLEYTDYWTTHGKDIDAQPIFTGNIFPYDFPKVAKTLRENSRIRNQELIDSGQTGLEGDIMKKSEKINRHNATFLLANIAHLSKLWMRQKVGTEFEDAGLGSVIEVVNHANAGDSKPGIILKTIQGSYKIIFSEPYGRSHDRNAWSVFIDTTHPVNTHLGNAQNFKLEPVEGGLFEAKFHNASINTNVDVTSEQITLLEKINLALEQITSAHKKTKKS